MKKIISLLFLGYFFTGCAPKTAWILFNKSSASTLEDGKNKFIELKDGTIIEGDTIIFQKTRSGVSEYVTVNNTHYLLKNIVAMQRSNKYSRKNITDPYFTERIIKGKINIYSLHLEGGSTSAFNSSTHTWSNSSYNASNYYYLQKGIGTPVIEYNDKLFEEFISDNPRALAKFQEYKSLSRKEKMINVNVIFDKVISIYNDGI